jgi:hypothetical protein
VIGGGGENFNDGGGPETIERRISNSIRKFLKRNAVFSGYKIQL